MKRKRRGLVAKIMPSLRPRELHRWYSEQVSPFQMECSSLMIRQELSLPEQLSTEDHRALSIRA